MRTAKPFGIVRKNQVAAKIPVLHVGGFGRHELLGLAHNRSYLGFSINWLTLEAVSNLGNFSKKSRLHVVCLVSFPFEPKSCCRFEVLASCLRRTEMLLAIEGVDTLSGIKGLRHTAALIAHASGSTHQRSYVLIDPFGLW